MLEIQFIKKVDVFFQNRIPAPVKKLKTLFADGDQLNFLAVLARGVHLMGSAPNNIRIEAAAQTAIAGDHNKAEALRLLVLQQRMQSMINFGRDVTEGIIKTFGIRARFQHAILRLAQTRRCHHFHGFGDLLRTLDAGDATPDGAKCCHSLYS